MLNDNESTPCCHVFHLHHWCSCCFSKSVSMPTWGIFQLSESIMKVSKLGLSSDTSASTKSSMVGRLCSIPAAQKHKAAGFSLCPTHICPWEGKSSGRTLGWTGFLFSITPSHLISESKSTAFWNILDEVTAVVFINQSTQIKKKRSNF